MQQDSFIHILMSVTSYCFADKEQIRYGDDTVSQ